MKATTRKPNTTESPKTLIVDLPPEVLKSLELHAHARGLSADEAGAEAIARQLKLVSEIDLESAAQGAVCLIHLMLAHLRDLKREVSAQDARNEPPLEFFDSGLDALGHLVECSLFDAVEDARDKTYAAKCRLLELQIEAAAAAGGGRTAGVPTAAHS